MIASSLCAASSEEVCKQRINSQKRPIDGGGHKQHTLMEDIVSVNVRAALVFIVK